MSAASLTPTRNERARRTRRLAIGLALVAALFYALFIGVSLLAGGH